MPKLPAKVAERVANADSSDFEALPPGVYPVELEEVDASGEGPKGPYWRWQLRVAEGEFENRKLWVNTSLSEAADFKMKETFEAFGFTTDSDTDEIVGQRCEAVVSVTTIQQGPRTGKQGNNVDRLQSADENDQSSEEDVF